MKDTKKLVETLLKYKEAYYSGSPLVSDKIFDETEEELRKISPDDPYFKIVGSPEKNEKTKFKHDIPMLSCSKVKKVEDLEKWLHKINVYGKEIVIESKIDGCSISLNYIDGKLVSAATRGDSIEGQLILEPIKLIHPFPQTISLKGNITIRGEAVIFKDSDIENEGDTNFRNIVSGALNRKTMNKKQLRHIHFLAYQIYNSEMNTESEKLEWLEKNGFEVTDFVVVKTIKEIGDYYNNYLNKLRDEFKYFSDGLVLVVNDSTLHESIDKMGSIDHDHLYAKAIKGENPSAETTLESILWQVSRNGRLQPVAIFKPVIIEGSTITKASLSNYATVIRMKLEIGDKLKIVKSGQIIPYVELNISKGISQR